jgi:hypothetical protein
MDISDYTLPLISEQTLPDISHQSLPVYDRYLLGSVTELSTGLACQYGAKFTTSDIHWLFDITAQSLPVAWLSV